MPGQVRDRQRPSRGGPPAQQRSHATPGRRQVSMPVVGRPGAACDRR